MNPRGHYNLGICYLYAGRLEDAIANFRTGLSLSPGYTGGQAFIGYALLVQGDPQAALVAIQKESSVWKQIYLPMAYYALGRTADSDAALAELIDKYAEGSAYNIASVLSFRGEADRAFEWLGKAVQYKTLASRISQSHPSFPISTVTRAGCRFWKVSAGRLRNWLPSSSR